MGGSSHEHSLTIAALAFVVGMLPVAAVFGLIAASWIEWFRRSRQKPAGRSVRGAIAARFAVSPD